MRFITGLLLVITITSFSRAQEAPKVQIGPGGELIVGGFDPNSFETAAQSAKGLESDMPRLKSLGVTSHEVYVRWNLCEVEPGKWDWSVYDRYVELYKKNGIKWVPFLICGSPYSLPDFYYKKAGYQGYVCLEHGEESDVQSLWNPEMQQHAAEFIKAFCEHYRDTGTIEAILLGVTGNYGEAIYPASGNDWTADRHGKYHTHQGFWAGDPFAKKDFAAYVKKKYETTEKLKAVWGGKAPAIESVQPFLPKDAPNARARIDFINWYQESMTSYAKFWLNETRRNFKGGIYLCTGGHAPPSHGADFGDQCKIAAEVGGGVRITNEASDYASNFTYTRWVAAAGEQYGAYFSFEPAGGVDETGVVARIYNAAASGAKGLHYYWPNLVQSPAATENFVRSGAMFKQAKPDVEIGVYYPTTQIKLSEDPNNFIYKEVFEPCAKLRDRFDFNFISDHMIADGGLSRVKALLVVKGESIEESTFNQLRDWVKAGGLLILADGDHPVVTPEGKKLVIGTDIGKGARMSINAEGKSDKFRDFVTSVLSKAPQLSGGSRAMVAADGKDDGLFVTRMSDGTLLWYNSTAKDATSTSGTKLRAISIVEGK